MSEGRNATKKTIMKYLVIKDCYCQHYLHEKIFYPRQGLEEKKLSAGDEVEFVKEWQNLYGSYLRVEKDGVTYDLLPENLKKQ
jgi:hypothetical protein